MALIEHTLFGTIDKVQTAIERLRAFEPKDRPYWLAFSGGKDIYDWWVGEEKKDDRQLSLLAEEDL